MGDAGGRGLHLPDGFLVSETRLPLPARMLDRAADGGLCPGGIFPDQVRVHAVPGPRRHVPPVCPGPLPAGERREGVAVCRRPLSAGYLHVQRFHGRRDRLAVRVGLHASPERDGRTPRPAGARVLVHGGGDAGDLLLLAAHDGDVPGFHAVPVHDSPHFF